MKLSDAVAKLISKKVRLESQYDFPFNAALELEGMRLDAGLSQAQLAKKIKTSQSAVARAESGRANMSVGFLNKAARACGKVLVVRFEEPLKENN